MRKLFLLTVLFPFYPILLHGQNDERTKVVVSIAAGLNSNDSWEVEPSVSYYLNRYVGGTLGLTVTGQYSQAGVSGVIPGNSKIYWSIEDEEANVFKILLRPAISLRTPVWWLDKDRVTGLSVQIDPGLYIALPVNDRVIVNYRDKDYIPTIIDSKRVSNTKGDFLFWNVRGSISLNIDEFILSTGYSISNFDIYSGRRNMIVENLKLDEKLPVRKHTYAFFISMGYRF